MGGDRSLDLRRSVSVRFNPRPRVGGDPNAAELIADRSVSIHAPAWGATCADISIAERRKSVSIHAPAWGATFDHGRAGQRRRVSIHAPAWGATPSTRGDQIRRASFNPRPRVGGDATSIGSGVIDHDRVSIHAPAWGATGLACRRRSSSEYMFQSTPPRGGRRARIMSIINDASVFQSTPPRGGRPRSSDAAVIRAVSIHAPAWGATAQDAAATSLCRFQSTPPRGGRRSAPSDDLALSSRFNPRPRVGGDIGDELADRRSKFQSTPPRGGRLSVASQVQRRRHVSIHAPAWGATSVSSATDSESRFQSTPPRGGRLQRSARHGSERCFNPRPRVGGDVSPSRGRAVMRSFNPRPRVGGDSSLGSIRLTDAVVSIHAPAWGAT